FVEEVADGSRAMMLGDEGPQRVGQLVLLGERESLVHMIADDLRACASREGIVRVATLGLVLHEKLWVRNLADVVVVGANASEQRVGSDGPAGDVGEIG